LAALGLILRRGRLVIMPTETVYGLAGDATNPDAVAAIYAAKGRPHFNPLIIHVQDAIAARRQGVFDARAESLAAAFWPGPLTLVLPRRPDSPIAELACAGLSSVALRAPAHPKAQELLWSAGRPLAAPSANRSGRISPTTAEDADAEFNGAIPTLDGGPCEAGLESTIVALPPDGPAALLRPGAIPRAAIEAVIGPLSAPKPGRVSAPGMLSSHYAPTAPVRLNALEKHPGERLLGFGPMAGDLNLSPSGDLKEAAARLYAALRALDAQNPEAIAVAPIPKDGLGEAINDRLARAAAPR
jgi:L-threonylcarbamoyladenylate synthase